MDWVHCNSCSGRPGQNKLYLNMCGHVFCQNCCSKAKDGLCFICKRPLKPTEINKNLAPELLDFFKEPIKIINDGMAEIKQVVAFQSKQREYFVKFRNSEVKRETDSFNETRMAHMKISQEMERRKKALSEENDKLKREKERKKQLTERFHSLQLQLHRRPTSSLLPSSTSSHLRLSRTRTEPIPSKTARFCAPKHPIRRGSQEIKAFPMHLLDQSTSKIVTSTPIANIDFSRRDYMNRMFGAGMANPSPILRH